MKKSLFALLFTSLIILTTGAESVNIRSAQHARQLSSGSAHDSLCSEAMCIECDVEGDVARYTLRSTGEQELGWMAIGFGEMMGGSPMVIMWPSRDEDGSYSSVTLSQRKAPFEVMPEPDPDPPFTATLYMEGTSVTEEHPQMAFTIPAPPDGLQEIIMAFSRTSPGSADENVPISVHHWSGQDVLNLTRIPTTADADIPPPPLSAPDAAENDDEGQVDAKIDESEKGASGKSGGGGGFASFLHAALCIAGFLFVIPSGALVARYAKATGSSTAFDLHQTLQFHVAGALIAGGMIIYLFTERNDSDTGHKWWGIGLLLLYGLQCVVGFQAQHTPVRDRARTQSALLMGLGVTIVVLAFYVAWLGFVAAGDSPLFCGILLIAIPSLYIVGVVVIHHHFQSVQVVAHGEYLVLDTRSPIDEDEVGEVHQAMRSAL